MKPRTLGVIAAVVALPTVATLVPGRLDGVTYSSSRTSAASSSLPSAAAIAGRVATLVGVKVTTTADETTSAGPDLSRDPAHRRRRLQGATCTNPGAGTNAYSLRGIRVNGPTTAYFNPVGAPAGAASALQAAYNTWHAADPNAPAINVVSGGTATRPRADGKYELMFGPLSGRTLGVTYTWSWGNGVYESDTIFNSSAAFFLAPGEGDGCYEGVLKYDLQNVATHEFGHTYGLDHVSSAYNTMAPTATLGETYKRSLAPGDAAGLRAIYH